MIKWSYVMPEKSSPLIGMTVGQLIEDSAKKFPHNELILSCYQGISKTYAQINIESEHFAAGLLSIGLKPGDRIAVWGPNSYEWVITMFAAAKAGLIIVNINPAYRSGELKYCLNKVKVKGIVCATQFKSSNYYAILAEVCPEIVIARPSTKVVTREMPTLQYVITMDDKCMNGTFNFKNIFRAGTPAGYNNLKKLKTKIQFDDPFNIQFTSGTTGNPKAAILSHFIVVNNARFGGARNGLDKNIERVALGVPLFHCFGLVVGLISNVIFGCATILPSPGFDAVAILKSVKENRVTSCYGTPTMFTDILNEYRKNPFKITHLHAGIMAGAPCPEYLVSAVITELKMKDFVVLFGMTETNATFQCFPSDPPKLRTTSIGCSLDHIEAKVIDGDGKIVPVGVAGELCIRGYSVFHGYWGDEEKTKEVLQHDLWLKTGDLVTMDENKYVSISGRIKDMIIRGGENVYPAEIENFFLGHSSIKEVQVFGVPDKRLGEEVAMWIKSSNTNLTGEDIRKWAKNKISHYKIPKYILQRNEFPTNASGKVQKFTMKEETIKYIGLRHNNGTFS